jgi:hypothetical protein
MERRGAKRSCDLPAERKNRHPIEVYQPMDVSYVGFGLRLRCGFPLPGMRPREAEGLPSLAVEQVEPERLAASWSGSRGAWRGQLGDGTELTIERGERGDLRITNRRRGDFRLDRRGELLECAPTDPSGLAWKRVLLSRVLPLAAMRQGAQALHASAVQSPAGVVAIAAASGGGKSTLAAELVARGWPHFTDDVLVISPSPDGPLVHPGTPHSTLAGNGPGPAPHELGEVLDVNDGEAWTAISASALGSCRLAAVVVLDRGGSGAPRTSALPASPLTLAPHMLGLPDEGPEAEARRFATYSDLAARARFLKLSADQRASSDELADALERALDARHGFAGAEAA